MHTLERADGASLYLAFLALSLCLDAHVRRLCSPLYTGSCDSPLSRHTLMHTHSLLLQYVEILCSPIPL